MVFFNEAAIYYFIVHYNMWELCIWYVSFRLPHIISLFITTCGNSVYGMYHLGCHILFHCSLQHVGTLSLRIYINEAAIYSRTAVAQTLMAQ